MLKNIVLSMIILPLVTALLISFFRKAEHEKMASRLVLSAAWLQTLLYISAVLLWGADGFAYLHWNAGTLLRLKEYSFDLDLLFDDVGAIYLGVTTVCGLVVVLFSRVYMHAEVGYSRFFGYLFLLLTGMSLISLANDLNVFFTGWEFVGVASFFLIAFYRHQTNSVKNALQIFALYRIGDLGLVFGSWLILNTAHGDEVLFSNLSSIVPILKGDSHHAFLFICGAIILAASIKSAQFPFCFYLPKAMEGPTPSSAIFYGALSVHAGVLLLMRTEVLWYSDVTFRIVIAIIGSIGALLATLCGRTQSSIKGQLAYASITQVGLMFVELALGLHSFVMVHFVLHAFLRSFQLLVSPFIITRIMQMHSSTTSDFFRSKRSLENLFPKRLQTAMYVAAIQDGFTEMLLNKIFVKPFLTVAQFVRVHILAVIVCVGVLSVMMVSVPIGFDSSYVSMTALLCLQMSFVLCALVEKFHAGRVVDFVGLAYVSAVGAAYPYGFWEAQGVTLVFSALPFWLLARGLIWHLGKREDVSLTDYKGLFTHYRTYMLIFFLCAASLAAIPPSPLFFGEDILLNSLAKASEFAALISAFAAMIAGFAMIRCAAILSMGKTGSPVSGHHYNTKLMRFSLISRKQLQRALASPRS